MKLIGPSFVPHGTLSPQGGQITTMTLYFYLAMKTFLITANGESGRFQIKFAMTLDLITTKCCVADYGQEPRKNDTIPNKEFFDVHDIKYPGV